MSARNLLQLLILTDGTNAAAYSAQRSVWLVHLREVIQFWGILGGGIQLPILDPIYGTFFLNVLQN